MVAGADIVAETKKHLGKPYVFGAEGPNTFDCSGLVQYVLGKFGISVPRLSSQQVKVGIPIKKDVAAMQPGDLVFSSWDGRPSSHVGIYVGDGKIINAPQPGENVKYATLNNTYMAHVDGVRRMPGVDGTAAGGGGFDVPLPDPVKDFINGAADGGVALRDWLSGSSESTGALGGLGAMVTEFADKIGRVAKTMSESFMSFGRLAELLMKLALPTTWVRIFAFIFGMTFVSMGLWHLYKGAAA